MASFSSLPNEIIESILTYNLSVRDIFQVGLVSCRFRNFINDRQILVKMTKERLHRLKSEDIIGNGNSFSDLIGTFDTRKLKVFCISLEKWCWIVGIWKRNIPYFGGLLQIMLVTSPSPQIIATEIQAVTLKVVPVQTFTISLLKDATSSDTTNLLSVEPECNYFEKSKHSCSVLQTKNNEFVWSCCEFQRNHDFERMNTDFRRSLGMNHRAIPDSILNKMSSKAGVGFSKITEKLSYSSKSPIKSGYFAGDYSAHACEIVSVESKDSVISIKKISGDKYVRSGTITISIDLDHRIDYVGVLKELVENTRSFRLNKAIDDYQMANNVTESDNDHNIQRVPVQISSRLDHPSFYMGDVQSFGLTRAEDNQSTFFSAYKGTITLGDNPDSVDPDYKYTNMISVIQDKDTIYNLVIYDEKQDHASHIHEMILKRVPNLP